MSLVFVGLTTLVVTLTLCPLTLRALRRLGLLDRPNSRSSHGAPTPRGGGLAVAVAAVVGLGLTSHIATPWKAGLLAASAGFGVLGLVDDVRGIAALHRLALQGVVAVGSLLFLLHDLQGPVSWQVVFGAGVLLWLVAYVNAFNFMDGINGISSAQAIVAGVAWWAIGRTQGLSSLSAGGVIIAAASAGFVPFNAPRARMFLGDVGSYFIGAWLAVLVVVGLRGGLTFEAAVGPVALYLADTATTIIRRVRSDEVWHQAHCDHAYQRLVKEGWSHTATALLVAGLIAICSFLGAVSLHGSVPLRLASDVAMAALVLSYLYAPTMAVARRRSAVLAP